MNGDTDQPSGLREIGESAVNTVLDRVGRGVSKVQERRPLAYDLLESDDAYLVVFDAPGATNSDVQVQFRNGAVEVKVDRFREFHEEFEMRFPGRGLSLDGRAELPEGADVDPTAADATLSENGTLSVRVPKTADDSPVEVTDEDDETSVSEEHDDDGPASIEIDDHSGDGDADDHGDDPNANGHDGADADDEHGDGADADDEHGDGADADDEHSDADADNEHSDDADDHHEA
jgi:HSP20 family molecular chaperone IbpA